MYRQFLRFCVTLLSVACFVHGGAQQADGQGLLRRIQSRIQAQLPPPPTPPASNLRPPRQSSYPPTSPYPSTGQRRLVQPLLPDSSSRRSNLPLQERLNLSGSGESILFPRLFPNGAADLLGQPGNRPSLGIEVNSSQGAIAGVEVVRFRAESLADEAGLQIGDVILGIDGRATPDANSIARLMVGKRHGQQVQARIIRDNVVQDLTIPLVGYREAAAKTPLSSRLPNSPLRAAPASTALPSRVSPTPASPQDLVQSVARLGAEVGDVRGVRGAVVTKVLPNTPADAAGLKAGDRIVSIDGGLIANRSALAQQLFGRGPEDAFTLRLVRDGSLITADVQLGVTSSAPAEASGEDAVSKPRSALEGIGSVLGGFLGGGNSEPSSAPSKSSPDTNDGVSKSRPSSVQQVGFEEVIKIENPFDQPISLQNQRMLKNVPPSLETIELPAGKAEPEELELPPQKNDAASEAEKLRREIRRLEQRLKELESKRAD
ncbi:MAG: PDZ domain-containing protein [Pirellulales bacterium]|nr:PDZ domain-containing protein [Pirellulales bacterium]